MPYVACREVVVDVACATVHVTDDHLQWASSHCARTSATPNGDLTRPDCRTWPNPNQHNATAERGDNCSVSAGLAHGKL